jgi:polyferredoxin
MATKTLIRSSWRTSLITAFVTFLFLMFLLGGQGGEPADMAWAAIFGLIGACAVISILRFGRLHGTRLIMFIVLGLFFTIIFSIEHQITRGSILLSDKQIDTGTGVPICPITLPFVVVPLAIRGEMIFPAAISALAFTGFFWLSMVVLFGRGFCGWICFFGGLDQGCAALSRRRIFKLGKWERWARLFPYALVLLLILVAVVALYPLYCAWICPLRLLYDPPEVTTSLDWLAAVIFVTGGMGLMVVGPLVTRKRFHCSYFCPLIPMNSLVGLVSPFRVKVDRSKCNDCKICIRTCPHSAMTEESLAKGTVTIECSRCGKCMQECPQGAIDFKLIGTNMGARPAFVALAVTFSLMLTGGYIRGLIHFLQTGTLGAIGGG